MEGRRPPMERAFHVGPRGRWWNNPEFAQKLGLTADQQKRMEAAADWVFAISLALTSGSWPRASNFAPSRPDALSALAAISRSSIFLGSTHMSDRRKCNFQCGNSVLERRAAKPTRDCRFLQWQHGADNGTGQRYRNCCHHVARIVAIER